MFLVIFIGAFSCTSEMLDGRDGETVLLSDDIATVTRSYKSECYPLNVIPDWVKDSLSSENYELLKKLSAKFEIKYYLLGENERQDSSIQAKYKQINELLANGIFDTGITSLEGQPEVRRELDEIEILSEGEGGNIEQGYDYASVIKNVESFTHGSASMIVKAYFTWKKYFKTRF